MTGVVPVSRHARPWALIALTTAAGLVVVEDAAAAAPALAAAAAEGVEFGVPPMSPQTPEQTHTPTPDSTNPVAAAA